MSFRIIGITGLKESGKDEVAKIIIDQCKNLNPVRLGFADALKEEIAAAIGLDVQYINDHKQNFRLIMQGWGTDFRRQLCNTDYWVIKLGNKLLRLSDTHHLFIVPDVRFKNEVEFIKKLDGELWRVERGQRSLDKHVSETELRDVSVDMVIENKGTLIQLRREVTKALTGFAKLKQTND